MSRMALQTQERLLQQKEIVVRGTMGTVAGPAVLRNIGMLEDIGSLLFRVTLSAYLFYRRFF